MNINIRLYNKIILFVLEASFGILYLADKLNGFAALVLALSILALFIFNKNGFFPPYNIFKTKKGRA